MLRILILLTTAASLPAALLTDNLGKSKRVTLEKLTVADKAVWDEYGLVEAETGKYEGGPKPFTATAWQLKDPTGAQAAFRWLKPAGAKTAPNDFSQYSKFAVADAKSVWMTHGNYLIHFEGAQPALDELKIFLFQLPKLDQSGLPPVLEYVPQEGRIAGTDRFINGPASLEKFFPAMSPSTAGFHFGTEAIVARYKVRNTEMTMGVFYYPTNQMARERQPEFEKVDGALVKRAGPLLAIIAKAGNADDAQRLLSQVNYRANVTINEHKPGGEAAKAGDMLVAIFSLIGVILALATMAGIMTFGMRFLRRRMAGGKDEEPMTMLHLSDRY
ncbi:MAG: hypothetical protein JNK87_36515 [Bryobacterales bacterium]|nr:hypothetical protein [Bryobacterales bacterium]